MGLAGFGRLAVLRFVFFWVGGRGVILHRSVGWGGGETICTIYIPYNDKNSDDIWGALSIVSFCWGGGEGRWGKGRAVWVNMGRWVIYLSLRSLFLYTRPSDGGVLLSSEGGRGGRGGGGCFDM